MMLKRRRTRGLAALPATAALTVADGDGDTPTSTGLPLSVEGLIEAQPQGGVSVVGFLVIDSNGSRLCSSLAEIRHLCQSSVAPRLRRSS